MSLWNFALFLVQGLLVVDSASVLRKSWMVSGWTLKYARDLQQDLQEFLLPVRRSLFQNGSTKILGLEWWRLCSMRECRYWNGVNRTDVGR